VTRTLLETANGETLVVEFDDTLPTGTARMALDTFATLVRDVTPTPPPTPQPHRKRRKVTRSTSIVYAAPSEEQLKAVSNGRFTDRERTVFQRVVCQGASRKKVARELGLHSTTVCESMRAIEARLGLQRLKSPVATPRRRRVAQ